MRPAGMDREGERGTQIEGERVETERVERERERERDRERQRETETERNRVFNLLIRQRSRDISRIIRDRS